MIVEIQITDTSNEYKQSIKQMIYNYLSDTYFKQWSFIYKLRKEHPELSRFELEKLLPIQLIVQDSLELNYGTNCSTTCTYCYLDRFSRKSGKYDETKLYPFSYTQYEENLRKFLKFLEVNKMTPISIDLFGGDVIFNRYGLLTLDVLYEHYSNLPVEYRPFEIVIPTNGTWISVDSLTERQLSYIEKFRSIGIGLYYSLSFDGLLELHNRPSLIEHILQRDKKSEEYVDKMFRLQKQYNMGFHPMVYSNKIEYWMDNFLWFQKMFYKYGINPFNLYLLEVRNVEWLPQQQVDLGVFVRFLTIFAHKLFGYMGNTIVVDENDRKRRESYTSWNILSSPFSKTYRGIGCSLQTTLQLSVQELTVSPCHRNNYKNQVGFKFIINDNDYSLDIEPYNFEYYMLLKTYSVTNQPYCQTCILRDVCNGLCPASQYENFAEPTVPMPTTCMQEYFKNIGIIYTLQELGLTPQFGNDHSLDLIMKFIQENPKFVELLKSKDDIIHQKIQQFKELLSIKDVDSIPIFTDYERKIFLKEV